MPVSSFISWRGRKDEISCRVVSQVVCIEKNKYILICFVDEKMRKSYNHEFLKENTC